jgi:hypothetical protein
MGAGPTAGRHDLKNALNLFAAQPAADGDEIDQSTGNNDRLGECTRCRAQRATTPPSHRDLLLSAGSSKTPLNDINSGFVTTFVPSASTTVDSLLP